MNGVAALRSVLVSDAALMALLPDYVPEGGGGARSRIVAGVLPLNAPLPAVALTSVSAVDLNMPKPGQYRFVRERVQASIIAKDYPQLKQVQAAVKAAASDKLDPAISGLVNVTIHTEAAGPDIANDDLSAFMGSIDFAVKYSEER